MSNLRYGNNLFNNLNDISKIKLFDDILQELISLLQDSYSRFKQSDAYYRLMRDNQV